MSVSGHISTVKESPSCVYQMYIESRWACLGQLPPSYSPTMDPTVNPTTEPTMEPTMRPTINSESPTLSLTVISSSVDFGNEGNNATESRWYLYVIMGFIIFGGMFMFMYYYKKRRKKKMGEEITKADKRNRSGSNVEMLGYDYTKLTDTFENDDLDTMEATVGK